MGGFVSHWMSERMVNYPDLRVVLVVVRIERNSAGFANRCAVCDRSGNEYTGHRDLDWVARRIFSVCKETASAQSCRGAAEVGGLNARGQPPRSRNCLARCA